MRPDAGRWAGAAVTEATSRGRVHPEAPAAYRTEFQRDRDRILHSASFRRLEYKTQVFVSHEGDMFRTRLTHSLEVSQIARTVARTLCLNEDLTESIALGHDLGHSPFGHAGQRALNACMRDHGGFEHNLQSLRVVDRIEHRYPAFPGLNLGFETREGLLKHCSIANAKRLGEIGRRFLDGTQPTLEAQICDIADAIAYNHHDIDDGIRSGLISLDQLQGFEPVATCLDAFEQATRDDERFRERIRTHPAAGSTLRRHTVIRRMIDYFVSDLVHTSAARLEAAAPRSPDEVRAAPGPLITMSDEARERHLAIKRFLFANLYHHPKVRARTASAERVVETLFAHYLAHPNEIGLEHVPASSLPRAVCDYVAGMTDRFAIDEFERATGEPPDALPIGAAARTLPR